MLLLDLLAQLTSHELRLIAAQLHLTRRKQQRTEWIALIHAQWLQETSRTRLLNRLSLPACRALWHLVGCRQVPASLFLGEFGTIHSTGRRRRKASLPLSVSDQALPVQATVTQELFQIALLFGAEERPIEQAQWLLLPEDLRALVAEWLQLQLQRWRISSSVAVTPALFSPSSFVLLHDLVQFLAFVRSSPISLQSGGRFPLQSDWGHLQPRLLALYDPVLAQRFESLAERQSAEGGRPWLRFLYFLAEAAGLLGDGLQQPLLWPWLRQSADDQIANLWDAWLHAPSSLRSRFQRLALEPIPNWRETLLAAAGPQNLPFTATDLSHRLLERTTYPALAALYWFRSLSELDQHLEQLLLELCEWGVVNAVGTVPAPFLRPIDTETGLELADCVLQTTYQISELGHLLLPTDKRGVLGWQWQSGATQWILCSPQRAKRSHPLDTCDQPSAGTEARPIDPPLECGA